jgi:hypothetical protein
LSLQCSMEDLRLAWFGYRAPQPEMPFMPPEPPPVQDDPKMSFYGLLCSFVVVSLVFLAVMVRDVTINPIDLIVGLLPQQPCASILIKVLMMAGLWSLIAEIRALARAKKELERKRQERREEIKRAQEIYERELKIYESELERTRALFHDRMESALRGFTFLKDSYESLLLEGQEKLKVRVVEEHLRLPLSRIIYCEASPSQVFIPDKFCITESEIQPLPLRDEMPCAFYCVMPEKLLIVPSSGAVMTSPDRMVGPSEVRNAVAKSPLRIDMRAASINALAQRASDIPLLLPRSTLISCDLSYRDVVNLQYRSDEGIMTIAMRDGRNALFSGTPALFDALRQALGNCREETPRELVPAC